MYWIISAININVVSFLLLYVKYQIQAITCTMKALYTQKLCTVFLKKYYPSIWHNNQNFNNIFYNERKRWFTYCEVWKYEARLCEKHRKAWTDI